MQRLATLWGALACISLATACQGDGLDTFTITESSEAVVPAGTLLEVLAADLPFGGNFLQFDIAQNQQFKNQGVKKSQIDSVTLTELRLRITSSHSGDLTFLQSLRFDVRSDGQQKVEVASGGPFDKGQREVSLSVTKAELRDHVAAPSMALTTSASGKRPKEETAIEATARLRVDVNLAGLLD